MCPQLEQALFFIANNQNKRKYVMIIQISNLYIKLTPFIAVRETREGNDLIIEGVYLEQNPEKPILSTAFGDNNGACPICALGVEVKHTVSLELLNWS